MANTANTETVQMTCEEAVALLKTIKAGLIEAKSQLRCVREHLFEMHERKGYKVLGYETWKDFVSKEFGMDRAMQGYILNVARFENEVGAKQALTPTAIMELRRIPSTEDRRSVVQALTYDSKPITQKSIRELIKTKAGLEREDRPIRLPRLPFCGIKKSADEGGYIISTRTNGLPVEILVPFDSLPESTEN